jgi:hypothetical protein
MVRLRSPQVKMSAANSPTRGQTSLEYLLLLMVVAVIVIASFSSNSNSLVSQIHDAAGGYYNTVTSVIMGNGNKTIDGRQITPVPGGWCPITCTAAGFGPTVMYGACECPAPAFGGASLPSSCPPGIVQCAAGQTCSGQEVTCGAASGSNPPTILPCGSCPTGQICVSDGAGGSKCSCPGANPLQCGGVNGTPVYSAPDSTCTQCQCYAGTLHNGCTYCQSSNNQCTTSFDGQTCVPITTSSTGCPDNMNCDTSTNICQCNLNTHWDQSANGGNGGCVYCQNSCMTYNATTLKCDTPVICPDPTTMYCNPNAIDKNNECACISGYKYTTGPGCVLCTHVCTATYQCGSSVGVDDCGMACTNATAGSCDNPVSLGLPSGFTTCSASGQCVCNPQEETCTPGQCGPDTCGKPNMCQCTTGECATSAASQLIPGTQTKISANTCCTPGPTCSGQCGSTAGVDDCGNTCTALAGTCQSGTCINGACLSGCTSNATPCPTDQICCPNGQTCVGGACQAQCTSPISVGACSVTMTETASGNTGSGNCPTECTGGPITATCTNGAWVNVTGSCVANTGTVWCPLLTRGSGICQTSLQAGEYKNGTAVGISCNSPCQGDGLSAQCYDGQWTNISFSCS